uniref:helix-turn-helix domain-containing protein n=1 Tax=uncultured Caulobacter sp. TaxID=158749 RepID=UPI0025ED8A6F|nr:helix-turn-helix domain-containing protein [uncultured Caulobacter sp.]
MERGVPIRSVSRSLAVLQVINAAGSMSLMEIARAVKVPYATAARLVLTLLHEGMIEKEPGRKNYRPTMLVQSLASGYNDHSHLGAVARQHIVDLTNKHGWPVAVSTRFGMNMIVRECTHTLSPYTLSTYYPGFVYPLLQSAAGLVHLAFSSERERDLSLLDLTASGDHDRTALGASEAALEDIRAKGYATRGRNRFTVPEGKNSAIAAPIFHQGRLCGTLALIFLASATRMDKAVELCAQDVVDTARAVSQDLDRLDANAGRRGPFEENIRAVG